MQKITPFLWFDGRLEEAVRFYVSVFGESAIVDLNPMSATFVLEGQRFMALNGGPQYAFTPAISLFVRCATQAEVDSTWEKLLAGGGEEQPCGWLRDRFGLSWQVVPDVLGRYLGDPDRQRAQRVVEAMLAMKKLDIAALDRAWAG